MVAISRTPTTAEFKQDPELYMEQVKNGSEPLVLTANNKPDVVLLTSEAYYALLDRIDLLDSVIGMYKAEGEFERGEGRDAHEALEELRQKLGIPR